MLLRCTIEPFESLIEPASKCVNARDVRRSLICELVPYIYQRCISLASFAQSIVSAALTHVRFCSSLSKLTSVSAHSIGLA